MKISKRIKAGLCALAATVLVAAAGMVVACSGDDDDSSDGEEEEEEEETSGEVDLSDYTIGDSDGGTLLVTASIVSEATEVVITFTNEGTGSDWLTLFDYSSSSWESEISAGIWDYSSSSGTTTITITSSGYTITSTLSGFSTITGTSYTLSTYATSGIWAAGSGCTVTSVTYTTGSTSTGEEEDDDDDDSTTYSLIDVSDWDELLESTLSVSSSSGDINTSGTLTQVLAADDFADYKAIVIQGTAVRAGYDTDGSTTLTSTASWLTAGGSSGSWTYGFISWPTATTTGSTTVSITYQLYADETNVVKVWEGGYEIYESSSIDDFEKGIYLAGQYVEDIMVYGYGGIISFEEVEDNSESSGDAGEHADSVELYDISVTLSSDFMMGFEGSCVSQLEEKGYDYCDADGETGDPFEIAADYGANWARVRLWHTPLTKSDGNNTTDRAIEMGKDIKSAGMSFLLDFHYSDDWADPGAQAYPEAWDEITELGDSDDTEDDGTLCGVVYSYTLDVLTKLKEAGCTPDMVQLGNEINNGMLMTLSDGSTDATVQCSAGSSNMAAVLTAAANAVHEVDTDIKIMLHIASNRRYSTTTYTSWFTTLESAGFSDYDYIGLSYYPFYGHGTVGALKDNIAALKAAGLGNNDSASVLVVETSWPWTNDNGDSTSNILTYSNAYMSAYMTEDSNNLSDSGSDLLDEIEFETYGSTSYIAFSAQNQVTIFEIIVEAVADAGGCGVFYWGSEWIPNSYTGSTWDNQALFDFDGICMPSMEMFSVGQ